MAIQNPTGTRCLAHPDDEAINRCKSCRKPLCAKCSQRKPEGVFCSDECWKKIKQHQERWNEQKARDAKFQEGEDARRKQARIVYFIIGLVFFGAGLYFVRHSQVPVVESIMAVLGPLLKKIGLLK